MRFDRRSDAQSWLASGGCPFYFHPLPPRCAVTRMALGGRDVFESDAEREFMATFDCGADMHSCPYVSAMWDIDPGDAEPDIPVVGLRRLFVPDMNMTIELGDGSSERPQVLIIPTTRLGAWASMGHDHGWDETTSASIDSELALYERPFSLGHVVPTRGWDSGSREILHAVIFDDVEGGGMTVDVIRSAILNALSMVDEMGAESVGVRPMCLPLPDGGSLPDPWHAVAIPTSMIFSLAQAGRLSSCRRYILDVLPGGMDIASAFLGSLSGSTTHG